MLVLIAAPFFSDYRANPLRFGVLQAALIVIISLVASGGWQGLRARLQNPVFTAFWSLLVCLSLVAPFLIQVLKF